MEEKKGIAKKLLEYKKRIIEFKDLTTSQYRGVAKIISKYWESYGGFRALTSSPYLHFAILISFLNYGMSINGSWSQKVLSIFPNLLGFSLAGYAILLAVSNEDFLRLLTKSSNKPLSSMSSSFVHFIFFQIITIIYALTWESSPIRNLPIELKLWVKSTLPFFQELYSIVKTIASHAGLILFTYSLLTSIALTMSIYRVYNWYEAYLVKTNEKKSGK